MVLQILRGWMVLVGVVAVSALAAAQDANPLQAVDTTSPQATMRTFQQLTTALETAVVELAAAPSRAQQREVLRLTQKLASILDLSDFPPSARRDTGRDAIVFLVDVMRRIDVPALDSIPDARAYPDPEKPASWSIPGSEITISRVMQGPRKGKFLFDPETVARAGEFYELVKGLPVKGPKPRVESWREGQLQLHGWMLPHGLVSALPGSVRWTVLDTPVWKVVLTLLVLAALALLLVEWGRRTAPDPKEHSPRSYLQRLLLPGAVIGAVLIATYLVGNQINAIGSFARMVEFALAFIAYAAGAWAAWLAVHVVMEWLISSPSISEQSLDAHLLRLLSRVLGILAVAITAAYGAQQLGLPVVGVLAGLGVGGLAVALAAQSSIENLIGGLNLYADRQIRVGDFCEYAGIRGTIEEIGLRSTRIRGVDGTLTSVPNSLLAKVHVTNFTLRDRMLFRHTLELRNDTTTAQLRELTGRIQSLLLAHPKVGQSVGRPRVHVTGFGEWSIKLEVFAYLNAGDVPTFLAIQEELALAVIDLVRESGAELVDLPGALLERGTAGAGRRVTRAT